MFGHPKTIRASADYCSLVLALFFCCLLSLFVSFFHCSQEQQGKLVERKLTSFLFWSNKWAHRGVHPWREEKMSSALKGSKTTAEEKGVRGESLKREFATLVKYASGLLLFLLF